MPHVEHVIRADDAVELISRRFDPIDPHVAEPWLEKIPSTDKELKWFPEHYHELHNEPDWLDVMNSVADWLEERVKCGSDVAAQTVGSEIRVS